MFDYDAARREGYTDQEIAEHLSERGGFNYSGASAEGYGDKEIVDHILLTENKELYEALETPGKVDSSYGLTPIGKQESTLGRGILGTPAPAPVAEPQRLEAPSPDKFLPTTPEPDYPLTPIGDKVDTRTSRTFAEDQQRKEFLAALPSHVKQSAVESVGGTLRSFGETDIVNLMGNIAKKINPAFRFTEMALDKFGVEAPVVRPIAHEWATKKGKELADRAGLTKEQLLKEVSNLAPINKEQELLLGVVESLGIAAPGMLLGPVAGPVPMLAMFGFSEYGRSYQEARGSGKTPEESRGFAARNAAIEVGTEYIPAVRMFAKGTPGFNRLIGVFTSEMGGESVATIGQNINSYVTKVGKDLSPEEFLVKMWEDLKTTWVTTAIVAPIQTGISHAGMKTIEKIKSMRAQPTKTPEDILRSGSLDEALSNFDQSLLPPTGVPLPQVDDSLEGAMEKFEYELQPMAQPEAQTGILAQPEEQRAIPEDKRTIPERLTEAVGKPTEMGTLAGMGITDEKAQIEQIVIDAVTKLENTAIVAKNSGMDEMAAKLHARAVDNGEKLKAAGGEFTAKTVDAAIVDIGIIKPPTPEPAPPPPPVPPKRGAFRAIHDKAVDDVIAEVEAMGSPAPTPEPQPVQPTIETTRAQEKAGIKPPIAKKPWEITKEEFKGMARSEKGRQYIENVQMHRTKVFDALSEGKNVPKHVIAEYPGIEKEVVENNKRIEEIEARKEKARVAVKEQEDKAEALKTKKIYDAAKHVEELSYKEPWEITVKDYVGGGRVTNKLKVQHKSEVERAISEGKEVPAIVLSEYPDLLEQSEQKAKPTVEQVTDKGSVAHGQEVDVAPTEAQKEAENYKKAHVRLDGMDITIENPAGSTRSGKDVSGKAWSIKLKNDYGYIKGSKGYDKDHVDVFFTKGYKGDAKTVHIVNQHNADGSFNEHKVVMGARNDMDAMALYNANYEKGWTGGKSVVEMPMDEFKVWVKSGEPKKGAVEVKAKDVVPEKKVEPAPEEVAVPEKPEVTDPTKKATPATKKGKVGGKLMEGEVKATASGRDTTPFPRVDITSHRKALNTVRRVDAWLIDNATTEAESRGDDFNLRQFEGVDRRNVTESDKASAEQYLFGDEQPSVLPPITKPLVSPEKKAAPPSAETVTELTQKIEKKPPEVTDKADAQEIKNSISEGEQILSSGKNSAGKLLSSGAYEAIRKSVEKSKKKIGADIVEVGDITVTRLNGNPFRTMASLRASAKQRGIDADSFVIVGKDGGFVGAAIKGDESVETVVEEKKEDVEKFSTSIKNIPKEVINNETGRAYIIEDLAQQIYKTGQTVQQFVKAMMNKLGKAYSKVRKHVRGLYVEIKDFTVSKAKDETGAIGQRQKPETTPEQQDFMDAGGFGVQDEKPFVKKFKDIKVLATDKMRQGMVDQFHSLNKILGDKNAWMMSHLTKSDTGVLMTAINVGTPVLDESGAVDIKEDSKSLKEIFKPLDGEIDRFLAWIAANRAEELAKEGRENLFTADQIQAGKTLNEGQEDLYESVRKDFEELGAAITDIAVKTGLVSEEEAQQWSEEGFYVPFYRIIEEQDDRTDRGPSNMQALTNQRAYKKLKGGKSQLDDLLTNTLLNWNHLISAGLRNQAGKKALETADDMGLAVEVPKSLKSSKAIYVRDNGQEVWYELDESPEGQLVLDSLMSLNYEGMNNVAMKGMRMFKSALTMGVTASPGFKIRNLIRDSLHAPAVSTASKNPLKNIAVGITKRKTMKRMEAGGGAFSQEGYIHGSDPDAIKQLVGVSKSSILNTQGKIKGLWRKYENFGNMLENINRVASFEKDLAAGKTLLEANFNSRDQMDFSRSGSFPAVRVLAQTVPFLNARMQGLDKLGRAVMDKDQQKQFAQVVGMYAVASVSLMLLMQDDEDYEEAEEWEKRTYHLFKVPGSDQMYRLPRPFEVGAIAYTAEKLTQVFLDKNYDVEDLNSALGHTLSETLAMNPIPQAFKPLVELYANKSMFTGRDIESASMKRLSKKERFQPWTSKTAQKFSAGMSALLPESATLSPIQTQHLVRSYTGWMGAQTLAAIDFLGKKIAREIEPHVKISEYKWNPVESLSRDKDTRSSKYVTKFYDNLEVLGREWADIQKYSESGRGEKITAEQVKRSLYRKVYNRISKKLSDLRKEEKEIYTSKTMTAKQKRERIKVIRKQKNMITKEMVTSTQDAF